MIRVGHVGTMEPKRMKLRRMKHVVELTPRPVRRICRQIQEIRAPKPRLPQKLLQIGFVIARVQVSGHDQRAADVRDDVRQFTELHAPRLPPDEANVPFRTLAWALISSFFPLALLIASMS